MQPCKLAMIASENAQAAGVSPSIWTFLQGILAAIFPQFATLFSSCFPTPTPPTPAKTREFVMVRYNTRRQRYANGILHRTMDSISEQATAQGATMNSADLQTTAICSLDAIRNGTDADLQEAINLAYPPQVSEPVVK